MTGPVEQVPERLAWLRWVDRLSSVLAVVAGAATILMMLNVVADVIGRYFFRHPLPGTIDLTQSVWMPTLVSLALGYSLLRGEHICVSLLTAPTRARTQRIVEIFAMAVSLVVVWMFIWFAVDKAQSAMELDEKAIAAPWLHTWPFRWVLVVGLIGLLLQIAATLLRAITVKEFHALDEDEAVASLEAEQTVLDSLETESHTPATAGQPGPVARETATPKLGKVVRP